jgi:thiol-disulfide isomerase/thioredoxin
MMKARVFTGLGIIGLGFAVVAVLANVIWSAQNPGVSLLAAPDRLPAAPEFVGITKWFNSKPISLADQRGKVVVVHFWTNGCINCIHNYPHYRAWQERYKDHMDFVMVGVHTPEFDSEKDLSRLKDRLVQNRLTFAVAVDTEAATWRAWDNRFWPAIYVVDKQGRVRHNWDGELGTEGFKTVTDQIDALLAEK